jgi:hypothetical protein
MAKTPPPPQARGCGTWTRVHLQKLVTLQASVRVRSLLPALNSNRLKTNSVVSKIYIQLTNL